jgi:hypothetical protein
MDRNLGEIAAQLVLDRQVSDDRYGVNATLTLSAAVEAIFTVPVTVASCCVRSSMLCAKEKSARLPLNAGRRAVQKIEAVARPIRGALARIRSGST